MYVVRPIVTVKSMCLLLTYSFRVSSYNTNSIQKFFIHISERSYELKELSHLSWLGALEQFVYLICSKAKFRRE